MFGSASLITETTLFVAITNKPTTKETIKFNDLRVLSPSVPNTFVFYSKANTKENTNKKGKTTSKRPKSLKN